MAKKGFIKDQNNIEILPITRGELILDSSGRQAFRSNEFLATDSQPGLMSSEDKYKLDHLEDSGTGANNKVAQINTTTNDVYRLLFSETADDIDRTEGSRKSANLTFNPSTGNVTALTFTGNLIGNALTAITASKLSTVSKKAWGQTYWTSAGIPTDISGDMTGVGNIIIVSGGNVDRFITFDTAATRSWRIGYLGTGSGDANYLAFQSTKTLTTADGWHDMLKIGCETGNATFTGQLTAAKFIGPLNNTLTFSAGTFSAKTYNNSEAVTVNVPTHTSHLTNDAGFLTQHQSLANYVTLNTNQTITGLKTFQSSSDTTGVSLILKNKNWYSNMATAMDFYNGSSYTVPNARIETKMVGNGNAGGTLIFYTQTKHASTNPNPNGLTERLRIDDNGLIKITGNLTVTGTSDFSAGTVKLDVLNIPTSNGGTTFGPGSNGQVLKSNGTTVYWASDSNSNTWRAIQVNGTQIAGTGTSTYALNFISGTGITVAGTSGSSSAVNSITITNAGVRSVAIGTGSNSNKVAVNTNGTTAYLTIPYATTAKSLSNYYSSRPTTIDPGVTGDGSMFQFKCTYSVTDTTTDPGDGHILHFNWDNNGKWDSQIYLNCGGTVLKTRGMNGTDWNSWVTYLSTSNYTSYLGYIGTTAVQSSSATQALTGISRISNSTSSPLYLGNSGNQSWVMTQDICSHSGSGSWAINIAGTAWFKNVNIGYTYNTTSGYNLGVTGTGYISSTLTMGGVINTASTPGTWVSGMSGAAIQYNKLTAIDSSSFWRFFNMKSSGGNVVCYGGLGNDIGFYGYYSGRTANGTDWRFTVATASGNWTATASIYAAHFYENSDLQLKTNIQEILNSDTMPIIKEFDWKESGEHSYGLIAQELEEQGYSELVSTKDDGYKTVNYSAALSLIVGKLQVKIKELEKEIEILKKKN